MKISAEKVKELRNKTGISIMLCKKALIEAKGDVEKAKAGLIKQGQKVVDKKLSRETHQGVITSYVHNNSQIGSLVEVHCETDFVAKSDDFKKLSRELALQIVGHAPLYISPDYIPQRDFKKQEKLLSEEFSQQGFKGDQLRKKITSKLEEFKKSHSLLSQPYFRDQRKTVEDLIKETITRVGENIQVKRFTRYQI